MVVAQSLIFIFIAFSVAAFLGIGPVLISFPRNFHRYSLFVAPATGYILFCFFSIYLSGVFELPIVVSNYYTLCGLLLCSVFSLFIYYKELGSILMATRWLLLPLALMLLFIFYAVLGQGINLFLGTANPDFLQSMAFVESLSVGHLPFWVDITKIFDLGSFANHLYPSAFQARFGGVVYATLLQQITALPVRAALMTSIVSFLLCLPGTVYFFCKAVLKFRQVEAVLSMVMIAISAPIAMSFIHTFVGQNSALPIFPLAISVGFLSLQKNDVKLAILLAFILNAGFWIYVMALPYVIVPMGCWFLVTCLYSPKNIFKNLIILSVVIIVSAVIHLSVFNISQQFIQDLLGLLAKLAQSHYYADFLTEDVFVYAMGLSSYNISNNDFFSHGPYAIFTLKAIGFILAFLYFYALKLWLKTAPKDSARLVISLLLTYICVWIYYTFINRYGYASFKMAAWLQFIVAPMFSWLILNSLLESSKRVNEHTIFRRMLKAGIAVLFISYVGLNLVSMISYIKKEYIVNRSNGSLINSYSVPNNIDYINLPTDLAPYLPEKSIIALGLGDVIQNDLATYYLDKIKKNIITTVLSHEEMPDDDAYLPDIVTRRVLNSFHSVGVDRQLYFNDGIADFFLLASAQNLDHDIVLNKQITKPLWSNKTFSLYKKDQVSDIVVTGRGYFRAEYMSNHDKWWWPNVFRWTNEGGEIYLLHPSLPGQPYSVQFTAIAGSGVVNGERTVEIWHNTKKIDEIVVNGVARIQSKPFYPVNGVNRIIFKIKEKSIPVMITMALWNRDLFNQHRQLNMLMSQVFVSNNQLHNTKILPMNKNIVIPRLLDVLDGFNGFDVNGWLRDSADISFHCQKNIHSVLLNILVPGLKEFSFPYKIRFVVNGVDKEVIYLKPGVYTTQLSLAPNNNFVSIKIYPQQAKLIADGYRQRETLQSVRLAGIMLI